VRVVLADDHRLIVEGIRRVLEEAGDFEVVGEAANGAQVLPLVGQTQPDLVLLDLRMPQMDGLTCLEQIRKRHPDVKVVILSATTDEKLIQTALERGASGFVVKRVNPVDLPSALRQAVEGSVFTLPAAAASPTGETAAREAGLTERETVILKALAEGLSNQQIGKRIWIAEQTVKFHLTNIYRKLGARNRTEAIRHAYRLGLVGNPLDDLEAE
jgi:DNA-binding NarL/FixJ family response regulator